MFLRVEAEAEVHCHTITSGAVSDFPSQANKITTELMKDVCRKFLTIIAIARSEISNGSLFNQRSRKQKPYPTHCGDGATKLTMILRAAN